MKLRKFNQINEDRIGFDDIDQPFENNSKKKDKDWDLSWLDDEDAKKAAESDLKNDPGFKKLNVDDYGEEIEPYGNFSSIYSSTPAPKTTKRTKPELTEEQEDVVKELTYLLRKMISNSGIQNFYISNDGYDICIQFIFQKVEKMKSIMRITNILKKINDDILIQYDPEIEMWETTKHEPMLTVDFYYEANKRGQKDAAPF